MKALPGWLRAGERDPPFQMYHNVEISIFTIVFDSIRQMRQSAPEAIDGRAQESCRANCAHITSAVTTRPLPLEQDTDFGLTTDG